MLSCDERLQPETWNPPGLQENVFVHPRSTLESLQIPHQGHHPFATPSATGEVPVLISTGAPVAREEGRIGNTIHADVCKQAVNHKILWSCGYSTEFSGWTAKTADIGTSI